MSQVLDDSNQPDLVGSPPRDRVRVVPLGGLGEFGMNMCAFEWGDDIIVVDCGLMLPDHDLLGVDLVTPDVSYLIQRADRVRGIVLTHGHEDHIGGLPYVLPQLNAPMPIYGSGLTMGFVESKLEEFDLLDKVELHTVAPRARRELGAFEVEFMSVTHSIPQAFSLAIRTPAGLIVHSGDYRIDASPVQGDGFDTYSLSKCGEEGVMLLMADSTNVERSGQSGSEWQVRDTLERLFAEAPRAVVMSMFSSSIYRMQVALWAAQKTGRRVFVSGYSIERNLSIAREHGCVSYPEGLIRPIGELNQCPPEERLVLATGTQGEALSSLSRMSLGNNRRVKIQAGDTIIVSARIIPGNERFVYRMINHFIAMGAKVFYERNADVHVSGHAHSGEMRSLLAMTKPACLLPAHGELYQLTAHRDLAVANGMNSENVFVIKDGQTLEVGRDGARLGPKVAVGRVLVDGKSVGEVGEVVLRDRRHLSKDGMITVILVIDQSNGEILAGPDIVSRGFVYMDESEALIQRCKEVVLDAYAEFDTQSREETEVVQTGVRRALRRFLREETDRYPVILPVVLEV